MSKYQSVSEQIVIYREWYIYQHDFNEFNDKYGLPAWQKLSTGDQILIRDKGMKAWEKRKEYKDDFEDLINND